ncbi:MAG: undecaprenyldiphospho-muramoylpentapeptide beta-N-acetylglucosaminyltransferase [Alphaproteobacteria bacterium]|nr:undecaprenyldiphospho-muramoylpentapeptide beta-N-acetylglucosaminyltransferase [Alphaproteobacteria bacterium]
MSGQGLIVLAAGGTGGHVFPAEALAAELSGRGFALALVTDARGRAIGVGGREVETHRVAAAGIAGKSIAGRLLGALSLGRGTVQAFGLLGRLSPRAVVGFGGYAAFPTMLAAALKGLPAVIHEQNAVLGRANRLLAGRMRRIATSFPRTAGLSARAAAGAVCTGMPVRPAVMAAPYRVPAADGPVRLFIIGGSQGARVLAAVVPAAIALLPESLRRRLVVAQQCRPEDAERAQLAYRRADVRAELSPFFADAPARMAAAHLVIARSGASTVAELAAVGRPAILVPYRFAADDHQTANAAAVVEAGAGWLMPESEFTGEALAARLAGLLDNPAHLAQAAAKASSLARPQAARALADVVVALLRSPPDNRTPPP